MSGTSPIITRVRRLLRAIRRHSARPWTSASRFYRGGSYVFNLIIWSRVVAGRTRHGSIELPLEILQKKGVDRRPPRLVIPDADAAGARFEAGFSAVYSLLFANLQKPGILSRYYHARPGPAFHGVYLWDSAFIAQIWKSWSTPIAAEVLQSVIRLSDGDRLQHVVSEFTDSPYTQPPLVAWSAVELGRWMRPEQRTEFFGEIFEPLARYQEWLESHRRLSNGLYFWAHPYESGVENAPRFGTRDERIYRDTRCLAAPDLCSYIVLQLEALAEIARELGQDVEGARYADRADRLRRRADALLWHEEDGVYHDRDVETGEWIRSRTIAGLLPLWAGIPSTERARRLREAVIAPDDFGTRVPLPSVSCRDPAFEKDMWRGPVWINTAYGVIQGLLRYGWETTAGELAYRLCTGVFEVFDKERQIYEFYDPEAFHTRDLHRKRGNRWKAFTLGSGPQKDFVGWTGLVNTLVIEVLFGVRLHRHTVELRPRLPEAAVDRIHVLEMPGRGLSIELVRRPGNRFEGSLRRGTALRRFSIEAGRSVDFPLHPKPLSCDTAT